MKPRHQVSRAAIEMIKRFEGYRRKAAQLPDGRWTLGYGHVRTARAGAQVAEADAEALLLYDLMDVAHAVNELALTPLNANQFDALCCFVFNIGVENYRTSSVLQRLNEGQVLHAAAEMELWRKADVQGRRIVLDALVRRRAAERALFLTPPDGWSAAATPLFAPKFDDASFEPAPLVAPSLPEVDAEPQEERAVAVAANSASERAAAAVGARLQQIMPEPEAQSGPALRLTPAPEFDIQDAEIVEADEPARQDGPTLFEVARKEPPKAPVAVAEPVAVERVPALGPGGFSLDKVDWQLAALPLLLAVLGVGLTAAALYWGFYARDVPADFDPRWVRLVGGLSGISMMSFAAYLALRRLGDPDED